MKINKIEIENFKNIKALTVKPENKTIVLIGENGKGKTSFRQAWYAALTGIFPDNCIKAGEDYCRVSIWLDDGNSISRYVYRDKPNKTLVNGKTSTAKSWTELVETNSGISKETIKTVSSAEVVEGMTSGEFGDFIVSFIPEELTVKTVLGYIPGVSKDVEKVIKEAFPKPTEAFGVETIKSAYSSFVETRKIKKRDLNVYETKVKAGEELPVARSIVEIDKDIEKVISEAAVEKGNEEAMRLWKNAVAKHDEDVKRRDAIKAKIDAIKVSRPTESHKNDIQNDINKAQDAVANSKSNIQTISKNISAFQNTLENLDKSVCPISEKLICTTDKSTFKKELEDLISQNEKLLSDEEKKLSNAESALSEALAKKNEFDEATIEYNRKITLTQELEELNKSITSIPKKPKEVSARNFEGEKEALQKERKDALAYNQYLEDKDKLEVLKTDVELYNNLCKTFEPKGVVMSEILNHYMAVFTTACNDKLSHISPDYEIKFVAEEGISFYVKTKSTGEFKTYESLSSGEKLISMFGILDMLNSLSGLKLLMLDDLDKLDSQIFENLLDVIQSPYVQDSYDNIIICCVDHPDTIDSLKKYSNIDFV